MYEGFAAEKREIKSQNDPRFGLLFKENQDSVFSALEEKMKEFQVKKNLPFRVDGQGMEWLEVEQKSTQVPVSSLSPYPEQNFQFHKLFPANELEFVIDCKLSW